MRFPILYSPVLLGKQPYSRKTMGIFGSNLIAYYPLSEASGATAFDISGNGHNGTYSGVVLGQEGIGDGKTAAYFDELATTKMDFFSAGFRDALNTEEFIVSFWFKPFNRAYWDDTTQAEMFRLYANASDHFNVHHRNGEKALWIPYRAAATWYEQTSPSMQGTEWTHALIIFSKSNNIFLTYYNGIQYKLSVNVAASNWTNALTAAHIGKYWKGYMAHVAISDYFAITDAQIRQLASTHYTPFQGLVLTFDDGDATQYSMAYAYGQPRGVKGTIYQVTDDIDGAGKCTTAQLQEMNTGGWDIGNHTSTHQDLGTLDLATQTTIIGDGKAALEAIGLTRASMHLAYPYGGVNSNTVPAMLATDTISGRDVSYTIANYWGMDARNRYCYDLNCASIQNADTLAAVQAAIEAQMLRGGFYMTLLHTINAWGEAKWQGLVDWIVSEGIQTYTISEFYVIMKQYQLELP